MDQEEAKAIIMTRFPGTEEEVAYCPHCLNPFNPWNVHLENEDYPCPAGQGANQGLLLDRFLGGKLKDATECIGDEPHQCTHDCERAKERARMNPVLKQKAATKREAFQTPWTHVVFCPHCFFPIHREEGPLSAPGYRAELLRRLFPHRLKITGELFN